MRSKTERAIPKDLRVLNVVKVRNRKQKMILLKIQWYPPSNEDIKPYKYRVSWSPVSKSQEEEKSSAEIRVVRAVRVFFPISIYSTIIFIFFLTPIEGRIKYRNNRKQRETTDKL